MKKLEKNNENKFFLKKLKKMKNIKNRNKEN